ncbi:helix-turn-helix domain-containing protein [Microbacterium sp. NPDC056052]|uniref:helix-turn-helix transcriptional regulator n=1 Tax=Microbacterium sp. NPDC056052 TaxID=3345695 RepID=UPI0035D7BA03
MDMDLPRDIVAPPGVIIDFVSAPYEGVRSYFLHTRASRLTIHLDSSNDYVILPSRGEATVQYQGRSTTVSRDQVAVFVVSTGNVSVTTRGMEALLVIAEGGNPDIRALAAVLGLEFAPIVLTDLLWGDVAALGAAVTRRSPELPEAQRHAQARFLEELYRRTAALTVGQLTREYRRSIHDRALDIVEVSAHNPTLNTQKIADMLGISARSLQRKFTGISLTEHIRRRRVELALALARTREGKDMTLTQLARAAGFADTRALRRALAASADSILHREG